MRDWKQTTAAVLATLGLMVVAAPASAVTTVRIASGLNRPLYVTAPVGAYGRLFIVQQTGQILIHENDSLYTRLFLDLSSIVKCCGERGLLGLAFHPDYATNGYFYVNYTRGPSFGGETVIARYEVSADPDSADENSELILLTITQPEPNHNGGCIQFGPDGMLYVGMGDGGGAFDQHGSIGNSQNPETLLGKMLRLDVDTTSPYVPADNPHVGAVDTLPEIWAHGLRNPWRFSFDRVTGDLYIGDVGQSDREEIDFQPAASTGGENYGWRCMEGTSCTGETGCTCNDPDLTPPISEYPHTLGLSLTGGYVYRGCAIPELTGHYFFADYVSARIWSYRYDGAVLSDSTERTAALDPQVTGQTISNISSFGEDAYGELYITDLSGEVYKIVPDVVIDCDSNGVHDSCEIAFGVTPDADANGVPDPCESPCICACHANPICDAVHDIFDLVQIAGVAFRNNPQSNDPDCPVAREDCNCDGDVNVFDAVHMVNVALKNMDPAGQFCNPCAP